MAAVKAGTDLTCGTEYRTLVDEVKAGRITEAEIDRSLERLFVARVRLGMFDPAERVPYSKITISEYDSSEHREVARDAERAAIVLLKNEGGVLPLSRSVRRIAVIGPSADDPVALLGNYNGISSKQVTPLGGSSGSSRPREVRYALGATYTAAHSRARSVDIPDAARGQRARRRSSSTSTIPTSRESRSCAGPSRARTSTWGWRTPPSSRRSATRSTRCAGRPR